jgi:hypothetical protein
MFLLIAYGYNCYHTLSSEWSNPGKRLFRGLCLAQNPPVVVHLVGFDAWMELVLRNQMTNWHAGLAGLNSFWDAGFGVNLEELVCILIGFFSSPMKRSITENPDRSGQNRRLNTEDRGMSSCVLSHVFG